MIVVDTSALIAIYFREAEAPQFEQALFDARQAVIAAPTALEFIMVGQGNVLRRPKPTGEPDALLSRPGLRIEPWTDYHLTVARNAFARFGKGQGHPAQLNFGDCMAYALAKSLDAPLLYKGDDFACTDIRAAI